MDKFLVVYNCCGAGSDNYEMWKNHLDSIITQKNCNFDLVISGCIISDSSKKRFIEDFSNSHKKIYINFIEELHPINVTFNHSVILISKNENYRGYLFLSSDIKIINDTDMCKMFEFHINENIGISNFIVDNENWIPTHIGQDYWQELQIKHADFPFGTSINCDCMLFDSEIYKTYSKIIPDIFRSWCTESVFPFLSASVNKSHKCHDTSITVHHAIERREGSSKIAKTGCEKGCDDLYRSQKDVWERLINQEGFESGFGYAESHYHVHKWTRESNMKMYLLHNKDAYLSPYRPKDTKRLVNFMKTAVFLTNEELDYNEIKFELHTL